MRALKQTFVFNSFIPKNKFFICFSIFFLIGKSFLYAQTPNVPYFYQYNNNINPGGSCQNTSIAMLLKYYGASSITPDNIGNTWGTTQAQSVSGFNTVCNSEAQSFGISAVCVSTSTGSFSTINNLLAQGIPVVVHGYFTSYGHVMVILAFTGTEYICNDPAGEWSQQYQYGGYSTTNATEGFQVHYAAAAFLNAIGPDNTVWFHYMNGVPPNLNNDNVSPTTQVTVPTNWVHQNFTANFTDADNTGGSGIEKSFYQVLEYNGTEWRANHKNGFFSDNFDNAIHPEWNVGSGVWAINGGFLEQTDEANSNTNIYALLTQNLSNRYLFNWQGKIGGTGTVRRAGFHFFCDSAAQTNRGNSYFVWFRADQSLLEIYKVVNNSFGAAVFSTPITISINTWYDYKVLFDRISGKMDVYVNNTLAGSWVDPIPYSNGNYISFRSGSCNYEVNDLKVYRSRLPSVTVSVGAASTNDVRYQNPNSATPACKVKSITRDSAGNLSSVASQNVNVDWTAPSAFFVNDGISLDIDTTNSLSELSANWTISADTNSGIIKYKYAIGTTAGASDITNWTDNGLNTSVTQTGLSLLSNQYYYFSVQSEDSAGLQSAIVVTNGQIVYITSIDEQNSEIGLSVYPNPFTNTANIRYKSAGNSINEIIVSDVLGNEIIRYTDIQPAGDYEITISAADLKLAEGIYFVRLKTDDTQKFARLCRILK